MNTFEYMINLKFNRINITIKRKERVVEVMVCNILTTMGRNKELGITVKARLMKQMKFLLKEIPIETSTISNMIRLDFHHRESLGPKEKTKIQIVERKKLTILSFPVLMLGRGMDFLLGIGKRVVGVR